MPRDYIQDLDDPQKANAFIQEATTGITAEISRAHAASTIYLAYQTKTAGEKLTGSVTSLTSALERALANHAQALHDAATASEKQAKGLNLATWTLVGVTVLLAFVQVYAMGKGCP